MKSRAAFLLGTGFLRTSFTSKSMAPFIRDVMLSHSLSIKVCDVSLSVCAPQFHFRRPEYMSYYMHSKFSYINGHAMHIPLAPSLLQSLSLSFNQKCFMNKMLSMKASCDSHGQDSSYFLGWEAYKNSPFHQLHNPCGIIQMGLAENQLSFDLLDSWLASNQESLELKKNGESLFKELALFQDYHGLPDTKNELVKLMARIRGNKVKFDPKKLVLTAGSAAANETLMFCLADPGEAFLLPTPYCPRFDGDLKWRTGVEIVPINCPSSNGFRITMYALEEAYQQAQKLKLKVKGVLVTNPSNPLGTTLTRNELNHLITFATAKRIHIVSDEIYSGTVFDSSPNSFVSIMEAVMDLNIDESHDLWSCIHIVYSLSKDFSMPGFRVGMIYSNNEIVVSAATKMSSFGLVSSQTQFFISSLISDKKFTRKYMKENRKRLSKRKEMLVSGLKAAGIKCLKSNSGLFSWVDMRQLMVSNTFEAEQELWRKITFAVGLNVSPGSSFHCSEPGWFRICFANITEETLHVALQRIKAFTQSHSSMQLRQRRSIIGKRVSKLSSSASHDHEPDR